MEFTKKTHYEKLKSTLENEKLPQEDKVRIEDAIKKYNDWISNIEKIKTSVKNPDEKLYDLVTIFNDYKYYIEFDLIFLSKNDFLYRQKGQLKLDNSIIEEFLPHLIDPSIIKDLKTDNLVVGPNTTFASVYFESNLSDQSPDGGLKIRTKDQDFSIAKKLYIMTSFDENFTLAKPKITYLSYIAAECKTNLDKTMFQEASATAHDIKSAIPGSKYFLICEWLDMTPISTAPTDIDEVLILRKAKRIPANRRKDFDTYKGRLANKEYYSQFLLTNPIYPDAIERFLTHIAKVIHNESLIEDDVLKQGYF
ncbi:Bpu10I family restriction endonuclease [Leptospira vanthielii]|uniref:Bpu10I restriction endonuclease n=1 Tax=Leptospira vanthielii serovar Holland str. Waz Holland = ATCC 700522 TaxID=1218591 RepID=N1WE26_9LEPT|nr:Bpu10I family restriction endonuclease [Leptospira vanthielii]EMY71630.1 Bpu10I restriction endonuclease [Leptospira vanthielii serovar Holland str. Waz Holland = ATCC 700522]